MVSHALFACQSLLTWHSLRLTSKSLSFGLWATFGFASIVADSWWFGLMVSRKGFESLWCVRLSSPFSFTSLARLTLGATAATTAATACARAFPLRAASSSARTASVRLCPSRLRRL